MESEWTINFPQPPSPLLVPPSAPFFGPLFSPPFYFLSVSNFFKSWRIQPDLLHVFFFSPFSFDGGFLQFCLGLGWVLLLGGMYLCVCWERKKGGEGFLNLTDGHVARFMV